MSSFARFVMGLCCSLLCVSGAEAGTKPLPGIVLAPSGHGFQTETGRPFVPFGVTYYRPGTGWAPQVWKQFDAAATQRDFKLMKEAGVNCVRVFLTFGSFLPEPGKLSEEGLGKFEFAYDDPPIPPPRNAPGSKWLLDYQHFREDLAQEWVRRQVMAIKSVDPKRLVTTGLVQWSVPSLLPALSLYSAFRPSKLAPLLDFLEVHR